MVGLAGKPVSYWIDSTEPSVYPALAGDLAFDAAIVGGGIVGLTLALLLKQRGKTVAVLEGRSVGDQVSGHTTAKITSQHGLIYHRLTEIAGQSGARIYAQSQQAAVEQVASLAAGFAPDCGFERKPAYVYSTDAGRRDDLRREADTAQRLGLPASYVEDVPLPFATGGAVRFDNQAQFHPVHYLRALARHIPGEGSQVFEGSRVLSVEDGQSLRKLTTSKGVVSATDAIVATNLPILDRGGYFAKCFPRRHMMAAGRIDLARMPRGMFLSADPPGYSFRMADGPDGPVLVGVGRSFKTGHADTVAEAGALQEFLVEHFGFVPLWRWGNQDYYSADDMPYIGRLQPFSQHLWTATGFGGWGMSGGTLAAMILADLIQGIANPWAGLYDSTRIRPVVTAGTLVSQNVSVAKEWIEDKLSRPGETLADLKAGEGRIVSVGGHKLAAWRDDLGTVHAYSASCTHMGCTVTWNPAEMTWDCPCHGSRFARDGSVINGPAIGPLEPKEVG